MSTVGPFSEHRLLIIQEGISSMHKGLFTILRGVFRVIKGFTKVLAGLIVNIFFSLITLFVNSAILIFRITPAGKGLLYINRSTLAEY
jgi:hypothetical protein